MPEKHSNYLSPMESWSSLEPYRRDIILQENKLSLFYYESGRIESPTLILIHGLGDEADTWRHVIYPLSESFHIIAIDLPGFGRSGKSNSAYSIPFFMKSLAELMDALKINRAFFMGSSLGGIIAHEMAIEYPNRVKGLILIGGALSQKKNVRDLGLWLMQIPGLGEWIYTRLRKNPQAAYESLYSVYHDLDEMPINDRDFLFKRVNKRVWSDAQRRAYFSTLRETAKWIKKNRKNIPQDLQRIQIPTLLIRGEFDNIFSKANALDLISNQSEVDFIIIEDAGHLPHQEKPDRFLSKLMPWLNSNSK